jgi:hypothetical protein
MPVTASPIAVAKPVAKTVTIAASAVEVIVAHKRRRWF